MERKRTDRRTQLRLDFAEQLQSINVPSLGTWKLTYRHREPNNEDFLNADVRGHVCFPGDGLSAALRKFTQARNLTKISMDGPICVGPELFWPETEGGKKPQWHALKVVDVAVSQVRPDGGWYIDLDPNRGSDSSDEDEDEDEEDDDSNQDSNEIDDMSSEKSSGYDSTDSSFAMDELPPDTYGYPEERRDERLNGWESNHRFRTQPNAELEKLFAAAARAAERMPGLRRKVVGLDIHPSSRRGRAFKSIRFVFLVAGIKNFKRCGTGG